MYKKASRLKLRFVTEKGNLSIEQLWDLPRTVLAREITKINETLKSSSISDELSFLSESVPTPEDEENTLKFQILKDVFITKKEEAEKARDAAKIKAHNTKIDELIARKQDEQLEGLSVEELEKLRK